MKQICRKDRFFFLATVLPCPVIFFPNWFKHLLKQLANKKWCKRSVAPFCCNETHLVEKSTNNIQLKKRQPLWLHFLSGCQTQKFMLMKTIPFGKWKVSYRPNHCPRSMLLLLDMPVAMISLLWLGKFQKILCNCRCVLSSDVGSHVWVHKFSEFLFGWDFRKNKISLL